MSKTKAAKMAIEDFIRSARDALDALQDLAGLFPAFSESEKSPAERVFSEEGGAAERLSAPDASGARMNAELGPTLEEVRTLLAEKARTGFRAEVKALLTAHGAKQLSDITDPVELGMMLTEAEKIGG